MLNALADWFVLWLVVSTRTRSYVRVYVRTQVHALFPAAPAAVFYNIVLEQVLVWLLTN